MRALILSLALCLLSLPALATAPLRVPLQGVIRDNAGVPVVEEVFEVTFALYDTVDAVDPVWVETWPPEGANCIDDPLACVHVVNGRFRLALGTHTPLSPAVFVASNGLWLGMKVETDPELERRPLGSAPYALHAATAHSAASAASLDCTGCIPPEALSNEAVLDILDTTLLAVQNAGYVHEGDLSAGSVPYDGAGSDLGAASVQGAIDELKALIDDGGAGGGPVNEGAGQVVAFQMSEAVPSYGTATQHVHLVNPSTPKVVTHLYGTQTAGAGGAGNLVVAYDFAPNQYSAGASGDAGDDSLHVTNPSLFNTGNHVMVYQTVGGNGATGGTWELNQVLSVNGNNLLFVKDLEHTYISDGTAKAQVILAASFGTLEVVGGGVVGPAAPLTADGAAGGVTYIRANQITVKNGGVIHADFAGLSSGAGAGSGGQGPSDCSSAGGGGNKEPGAPGAPGDPCQVESGTGGTANADSGGALHMGGAGGGIGSAAGGVGGGLVVLGAKTVIVETGGRISAQGADGTVAGAGAGAGGTVALFTEQLQNEGDIDVTGGSGGLAGSAEFVHPPEAVATLNYNTRSHGAGYSPYHDEFWYPEWSGSTIYRKKPGTFEEFDSFGAPRNEIMGLWGMPDGGYLIAQWSGAGYVYRVSALGGGEVWQSDGMDHNSGGACFDGEWIWSMHYNNSTLWKLNPSNGNIEEQFNLSAVSGSTYGGLVCVPGRLYRTSSDGCIRVWDLTTNPPAHLSTECGYSGAENTAFDGQFIYTSNGGSTVQKIRITTGSVYASNGGDGSEGWIRQESPIPGVVNESFPKGVRLIIDGNDVTASVGDPNGKGDQVYDAIGGWGATGLDPWSTGPLDVTNVANWTLGEHVVELRETGGAGGQLKAYTYVIYPFTESTPPVNDTCSSPVALDPNSGPVVVSGTTEDIMGKTLATDANQQAGCGGQGGSDVVYRIDLDQRSLLNVVVQAPFPTRLYLRETSCVSGSQVYCADGDFTTNPIDAGTYFLFVDSNAPIAKGDFTLAISTTPAELPANDTCDSAEVLDFGDNGVATVTSSTLYALDQSQAFCAAQGGGPDVVYRFTIDETHSIDAQITAGFDTVLSLMKGACSGDTAVPFACNDQGSLGQFLPPGDYWLIVDGAGEKVWGEYTLTVTLN